MHLNVTYGRKPGQGHGGYSGHCQAGVTRHIRGLWVGRSIRVPSVSGVALARTERSPRQLGLRIIA